LITASEHLDIAFLILVGFSAVSPSRQMRYSTENLLRSAGFGKEAVDKLAELRNVWEAYRRGDIPRNLAQGRIDEFASLPWFELAYVPTQVPERSNLGDPDFFDFDPAGPLARVRCPLLVLYGAGDIEVPVEESRAIITSVTDTHGSPEATMHCYPGVGHFLTRDDQEKITALAPHYESDLIRWFQLSRAR
jgi:pimeloyl-ACP methyl ester carboxylesterase